MPYRIRKAIEAHDTLTTENAMWVARATVIANQQPGSGEPGRDTQASRAKAAEAAAAKRRSKKEQAVQRQQLQQQQQQQQQQ